MRELLINSASPEETEALGCVLGRAAFAGCLVCLVGPLGAGKTVLARGIARGLGVAAGVKSPSFVYVRIHRGRLAFYHVDLYQISRPEEVESIGLDEILAGEGVTAIEWADRIADWLPPERLDVRIEFANDGRTIALTAADAGHAALVAAAAEG